MEAPVSNKVPESNLHAGRWAAIGGLFLRVVGLIECAVGSQDRASRNSRVSSVLRQLRHRIISVVDALDCGLTAHLDLEW